MTLRQLRELRGMPCTEASRRIGVNRATLANWENGETELKAKYVDAIARVYNVGVEEVLKCLQSE